MSLDWDLRLSFQLLFMVVDQKAQENDQDQEHEKFKVNLFGIFGVFQLHFDWHEFLRDGHWAVILVLHWLLIVKVQEVKIAHSLHFWAMDG